MPNSPQLADQRLRNAINSWRSLRPTKKFLGFTVDDFEAELKSCFKTREDIADLKNRLAATIVTRDEADRTGAQFLLRLAHAVQADADEGEDSELLQALGYVIKSKRKSGLHRGSAANITALPKAA